MKDAKNFRKKLLRLNFHHSLTHIFMRFLFIKKICFFAIFAALLTIIACDTAKKTASSSVKDGTVKDGIVENNTAKGDDGSIDITLLHINDVYEISALDGGKIGGMARVATLKKQLKAENATTTLFLAGDFVSPSVIGTLKVDGKRVRGKQMIDVLNAVGVDWATFGNHEFDIPFDDLQERLNESEFRYVSSNVTHIQGDVVDVFHQFQKDGTRDVLNHAIISYKARRGGSAGLLAEADFPRRLAR